MKSWSTPPQPPLFFYAESPDVSALFTGNKIKRARRRGDGVATSATQTQGSGCDGRISIVHFQKLCLTPPSPALPTFTAPTPFPSLPPQKLGMYICTYSGFFFFPERTIATPIPNDASVSGNAVGGGTGGLLGGVVGQAGS